MERIVIGSSSGDKAGAGRGDRETQMAAASLSENITEINADSLAETLTTQLLPTLIDNNVWSYRGRLVTELPFNMRLKFMVDQNAALRKAQSGLILQQLGVPLDATDLRDQIGFKASKEAPTELQGGQVGVPGGGGAINGQGGPPSPNGFGKAGGAAGNAQVTGAANKAGAMGGNTNIAAKGAAPGPSSHGGRPKMPQTFPTTEPRMPSLVRGGRYVYARRKSKRLRKIERNGNHNDGTDA
jgi:hypothetical protein